MQPGIILYTEFSSARLDYVLQWIFRDQLRLNLRSVSNWEEWLAADGIKINYSRREAPADILTILPESLLQETGIRDIKPSLHRWRRSTILFYNQPGAVIPFDLFSAVFFLLSRYEEYLPYKADRHGRFPAQCSWAAQYAFLQQPVIDEWLVQLRNLLGKHYGLILPPQESSFLTTFDIDIAWKYRNKGWKRTLGGYLRDVLQLQWRSVAERTLVLGGNRTDPYYNFQWLESVHRQYKLRPLFFLLLAQESKYDKNADPQQPQMKQLVADLASKYIAGIHPSYAANLQPALLNQEMQLLQSMTGKDVSHSRQHYIKLHLPHTYRTLIEAGITNDFSMGYPDSNGFRAGTSHAFLWYDLTVETSTSLRVHPFAFMDATARFYNKADPDTAFAEWERLYEAVRKTNGCFIQIFHNHLLASDRQNKSWRGLYERILKRANSHIT